LPEAKDGWSRLKAISLIAYCDHAPTGSKHLGSSSIALTIFNRV
jgi:hypothetical protein